MTEVRPTLRALRRLQGSRAATEAKKTLERAIDAQKQHGEVRSILAELRLADLQHPLLDDARQRFAQGLPDPHKSSSQAASVPIYEVRDAAGAAWRGAVMLDGNVAWLVYADRHDRFHRTAADYLKSGKWKPTALDWEVQKREAVDRARRRWKVALFSGVLETLGEAAVGDSAVTLDTPPLPSGPFEGKSWRVTMEVDNDPPARMAQEAHLSSGILTVVVHVPSDAHEVRDELSKIVKYIQPDDEQNDQAYMPDDSMLHVVTLSHARLVQLTLDAEVPNDTSPAEPAAPTVLHYVGKSALAEGVVNGTAVRSLCGRAWFVPSRTENSGLPICPDCEDLEPAAQALLTALSEREA